MNILAVDTSFKIPSVCVVRGEDEPVLLTDPAPLQHSATLLPLCLRALETSGLALSDIDIFASSRGPGSFTGIRIGISAIKGFAFSQNKPCAGISSLEAAARTAPEGRDILALIRAREGEYYAARFSTKNGFERLSEDGVIGEELLNIKDGLFLCGDGARDFCDGAPLQSALGVAEAVRREPQRAGSCHLLTPVYLKPSQAERLKMKEG